MWSKRKQSLLLLLLLLLLGIALGSHLAEVSPPSRPTSSCPWFLDFEVPLLDEDSHEDRVLAQLSFIQQRNSTCDRNVHKQQARTEVRSAAPDREEKEKEKKKRRCLPPLPSTSLTLVCTRTLRAGEDTKGRLATSRTRQEEGDGSRRPLSVSCQPVPDLADPYLLELEGTRKEASMTWFTSGALRARK